MSGERKGRHWMAVDLEREQKSLVWWCWLFAGIAMTIALIALEHGSFS